MQIIIAFILLLLVYRKVANIMTKKSTEDTPKEEKEVKRESAHLSFKEILEEEKEMEDNETIVAFDKTINKLTELRQDIKQSMLQAVEEQDYHKVSKLLELDEKVIEEIEKRQPSQKDKKGLFERALFRTGKLVGSLTRGFKEGIVKDTD